LEKILSKPAILGSKRDHKKAQDKNNYGRVADEV
jgi:hypothetical protein